MTVAQGRDFAIFSLFLFSVFVTSSACHATSENDFFEMPLEELAAQPYVVSSSRSKQKINEASMAISIVTAEDIHYSGLTSLADILQFAPGMDYLRFNRFQNDAIGVRGMHDLTSDRLLTLVDGRPADSPFYGGPEFYRLPIMLEDIERVEIIRGPGGAAWGANAFTGVINIITKKPSDTTGLFASSTINEYGDSYSHLRFGFDDNKLAMRFSLGYEDLEDSDAAGAGRYESSYPSINGLIGYSTFEAHDIRRNLVFSTDGEYKISPSTNLLFGFGYSHFFWGDYELLGFYPRETDLHDTYRFYAKIDHEFEDGTKGFLQWSSNYAKTDSSIYTLFRTWENDIQTQLDFTPSDQHKISIGANVRFINVNGDMDRSEELVLNGEPFDEQMAGLFYIHRFELNDRIAMEGQLRGDWYSETTEEWSGRFTTFYKLTEDGNHILRFGAAKAFRVPLSALRRVSTTRVSLPSPPYTPYLAQIIDPHDLENEETWSLETGLSSNLNENTRFKADFFYQRFRKMIGYVPTASATSLLAYSVDNVDGADLYGTEFEIVTKNKLGKFSAWYSYHNIQRDEVHVSYRAYEPARNKVGATARFFLPEQFTFNVNYKYATTTRCTSQNIGNSADMSHRFDLTLAKEFADGHGEMMVGVADLINETQGPNYLFGSVTAFETPGRTVFARLQLKY